MTDGRIGGSSHPREFSSNPSLSFLPVTILSLIENAEENSGATLSKASRTAGIEPLSHHLPSPSGGDHAPGQNIEVQGL